MAIICPTVTAYSENEYRQQMEKVSHLGRRIQIDLTDGIFTSEKTVSAEKAWWPVGLMADFHLMYKNPINAINKALIHKPNLIIIHAEAEGDFSQVRNLCSAHSVKLGVALLPETSEESILPELRSIDHVLIFSGNLGYQGGSEANLSLLSKVKNLKNQKAELEVGWDGGVNNQNVSELVFGGVDVINVGGFLQKAEDPARAYQSLARIAEETGTT